MTDLFAAPRAAAAAALGAGSALRGARVFHPRGQARTCRLLVSGGGDWGARVLDETAQHEGVARLSRGLGLPSPLPDVEGLAVRLPGLGVDGQPLDLLVNSAWRFVFVPRAVSTTWSGILAYRTGSGRTVLVGARAEDDAFTLVAASPLGRWVPWARLELGDPVDGEQLRFRPERGAPDLQPTGPFWALRTRAYDESQAHRP